MTGGVKYIIPLVISMVIALAGPALGQALNDQVTQETIATTICRKGWSASVRPPLAWSHAVKLRLAHGRRLRDYELDHWMPIELGGAPADERNLWLQPIEEARRKDWDENWLHRAVCAGGMSLAAAQEEMLRLWPAR
jgi:hypothetical protein